MFVVAFVPWMLIVSAVAQVVSVACHFSVFGVAHRDWLLGHGTVNVIMSMPPGRLPIAIPSGWPIGVVPHVALISLEVCARALPILPHGLYTDSAVTVSKTRRPPTACTTSWMRNSLKSPVGNVVATAIRAMRLTFGMCINKTPVATVVRTSFATIQ
jgi:hypothetical protein